MDTNKECFDSKFVDDWVKSLEQHRDGLKNRAWLCQKMIDNIQAHRKKHRGNNHGQDKV